MWNKLFQAAIITFLLSVVMGNNASGPLRSVPQSASFTFPVAQDLPFNRIFSSKTAFKLSFKP